MGTFLIIAQTRPELITKMKDLIGNYEMAIIPRSIFVPDGVMLLTIDKSSLMKLILDQAPCHPPPL